jgi:hypothetical protein
MSYQLKDLLPPDAKCPTLGEFGAVLAKRHKIYAEINTSEYIRAVDRLLRRELATLLGVRHEPYWDWFNVKSWAANGYEFDADVPVNQLERRRVTITLWPDGILKIIKDEVYDEPA